MEIFLARSQGFCAGVANAVEMVEQALERFGAPLYVYHEIVHNTFVVSDFSGRGVVFVDDIDEIPEGARVILSAHGVPPEVISSAKKRNLKFVDATCPLVTKVHKEAVKFSFQQRPTILIGHKGHQELIGTAGYVNPKYLYIIENEKDVEQLAIPSDTPIGYLTQTTLSVDETKGIIAKLKRKFPKLEGPARSDICYATQNRQDSVKELARVCDLIIICGSPNSSNSNRLRETGANEGVPSYIIDRAEELDLSVLNGKERIGISSGASVPRFIVDELIERIKATNGVVQVHSFENPEKNIIFKLPGLEALV